MTVASTTIAATCAAGPFASLAKFQQAHDALSDALGDDVLSDNHPDCVAGLVRRGVALGASLDDKDERATAQALINFWAAKLSSAVRQRWREADRARASETYEASATAPPDDLSALDNTLLVPFDPDTIRKAREAADAWIKGLSEGDRTTVNRLLLRLVRLRPNEYEFDVVPTSRSALQDMDLTPPASADGSFRLSSIDDLMSGLVATGAVRLTRGQTPEADQFALRSATLLNDWPTLRAALEERKQLRRQAEEWYERASGAKPNLFTRCRAYLRRYFRWAINTVVFVCESVEKLWERSRRAVGLRPSLGASLLTGRKLEEMRTYHDRNVAERQFIVKSRYSELEGHKRSRVFAIVLALLVLIAAIGWGRAVVETQEADKARGVAETRRVEAEDARRAAEAAKTDADRRRREVLRESGAREMQMAAEGASNLALGLILMSEAEGLTHSAKKLLIIQTLGQALFWQTDDERRRGSQKWEVLKRALTAEGAPAHGWFDHFFNTRYKDAIERITSGKADRTAVQDLREISSALRLFIHNPSVRDPATGKDDPEKAAVAKRDIEIAMVTIRGVACEQLAQVTNRLVGMAEGVSSKGTVFEPRIAEEVRGFRNFYWRLYACEVPLVQRENDPLQPATEAFAKALWEWEGSTDGKASPDTIKKLKYARDQVHEACGRKLPK